jgi:hypothetical protein
MSDGSLAVSNLEYRWIMANLTTASWLAASLSYHIATARHSFSQPTHCSTTRGGDTTHDRIARGRRRAAGRSDVG